MKNKNKIYKKKKEILLVLTLIIFVFLFNIDNVYALGITPGRTTLNFESNAEKEVHVQFRIVNTDYKIMNVSLKTEGEWSDYVILNQTTLNFNADEYMKTLSYRVKFPSSINDEGIKAKIIASEIVSDKTSEGTTTGVKIAVEHQLYIMTNISIPEEKEIDITRVFVEYYQKGESAKVEVEIKNPSDKTMKDVHSTMKVYDKTGMLRSQFNSISKDIKPDESEIIEAYWDTLGFEEGDYGANLIVYYDNKTEEQNLLIYLGSDKIEIDFGKFEFEKKPFEEFIIEHEEIKIGPEIFVLMIVILIFIIVDIIVLIRLKKIKHKK